MLRSSQQPCCDYVFILCKVSQVELRASVFDVPVDVPAVLDGPVKVKTVDFDDFSPVCVGDETPGVSE